MVWMNANTEVILRIQKNSSYWMITDVLIEAVYHSDYRMS